MPLYTDQCGRSVSIPQNPKRIISLVPSQTELLFYLGLADRVAGITKFCIHPNNWFRTKTRVGGTKTIKIDIIHQLRPDLIIANKEENVKEQVEELASHYPVWVSDVNNLNDALEMIAGVGIITLTDEKAEVLIRAIQHEFNSLKKEPGTKRQHPMTDIQKEEEKISVFNESSISVSLFQTPDPTCYLIWKDPYITIGGDTFINNMLQHAGLANAFVHLSRYPEISLSQLQTCLSGGQDSNYKLLLLSSEPYPFKQQDIDELQTQLPGIRILLVDGEMFSWYGSRLLKAPAYFKELGARIAALRLP